MLIKFGNFDTNFYKKGLLYESYATQPREDYFNKKQEKLIPKTVDTAKQGQQININGITLTITDPYGIRNFKGREGQHSTGLDFTSSNGKAVALQGGVIESVKLQGDGSIIKPEEGSTAGWYVTVRNNDGTKMQYMHLDPMSNEEMKSLEGKKIEKGDVIWGYTVGSGSMTGKHFKVRQYTGSNPQKNHIDPSINLFE